MSRSASKGATKRPLTAAEAIAKGEQSLAAKRGKAAVKAAEPVPAVRPPPPPAFGAFRLAEMRPRQCKFACTPDHVPSYAHRFCGRPTVDRFDTWCVEHKGVVYDELRPLRRKAAA